jgi:hypothetical protein
VVVVSSQRRWQWWWWLAGGGPALCFFFIFLLFVVRLNSSARQRCWTPSPWGAPSGAFICRASPVAHDKDCLPCVSEESARQSDFTVQKSVVRSLSYGPPWAHYLGGYQDRLLSGPLGLPSLRYTAPEGVEHKDYTRVVLG